MSPRPTTADPRHRRLAARFGGIAVAALAALAPPAAAQGTPTGGAPPPDRSPNDALLGEAPPPDGGIRGGPPKDQPSTVPGGTEVAFAAPSEEDWKRPCLLVFQRTWEDAVAVARETGRPILICVNMDGEPASEHYAGIRYRRPEIAALYEPYVCVLASVYRHTPKDHDEQGRRVTCPRFGSVTCGEHIAIEPFLYAKYFDGQRIAPRHLMIELDGRETYDVFYANDTDSVFRMIRKGISERKAKTRVVVRGDRPIVERVASHDVADREAVEAAFRDGDAALRKALLAAAEKNPDAAPHELQRLALFGLDAELAALARRTLAGAKSGQAVGLIAEALKGPLDPKDREALLEALGRLGEKTPRARWISVVHRGLTGRSETLDVGGWTRGAEYPATGGPGGGAAGGPTAGTPGGDAEAEIAEAESCLSRALAARREGQTSPRATQVFAGLLFEDARRAALRAEAAGGVAWRSRAVLAIAAWHEGDAEEAYARAEEAVKVIPPGEPGWNAWAAVTIFAEGRWKAIKREVVAKKEWPPSWLTDLHAAFSILGSHPHGTDAQIAWHHELLEWLGSKDQAARALAQGLERFPLSEALHARHRATLLAERGADGLEADYAARLAAKGRPRGLEWFAGLASVAAAEGHRNLRRPEKAREAYLRAEDRFEAARKADPGSADRCDRALAQAAAGRARIALMLREDEAAVKAILESLERSPAAAEEKDALGFSPADTARFLLARLKEKKRGELAHRVEKALKAVQAATATPDGE